MFWLVVATLAAIAAAALLMSDIRAEVSLKREQGDDELRLSLVALFGLVRRQIDIPVLKWDGDGIKMKVESGKKGTAKAAGEPSRTVKIDKRKVKRGYRYFVQLMRATLELKKWLAASLRKVRCRDVVWVTQIGLGDAADSAVAAGVVWGVKAPVVGWVASSVRMMNEPRLAVVPLFNEWHFETVVQGKFRIRLATALAVLIHLAWRVLRIRGGIRRWWKVWRDMRARKRRRKAEQAREQGRAAASTTATAGNGENGGAGA